jgi:hypothetical protein
VTAGVGMGVYWRIPKKGNPGASGYREEHDGTHRNFPEGMRNHPIPRRSQQALSRFSKVGVNKEVEYLQTVLASQFPHFVGAFENYAEGLLK